MKRKIIHISEWLLISCVFFSLVAFNISRSKHQLCKNVKIEIFGDQDLKFIEEEDVRQIVNANQLIYNHSINEISLLQIKAILDGNPYVQQSKIYKTIDGELHIELDQNEPLARLFCENGESIYLSNSGTIMPLCEKYTARVMVFELLESSPEAYLGNEEGQNKLIEIYQLAKYITKDALLKSQVVQVKINASGEFSLIPRVGDQLIEIGKAENLEEKFKKLKIFYTSDYKKYDWNQYKIINLKYENQVVCSKK